MRFVLRLFSLAAAAVLLSAHPAFASRILFGVDNTGDGDQLYKIDVGATTPALELVGDITTTSGERLFGIAGLAWDSKRGFLVGISEDGPFAGLYMLTIEGASVIATQLNRVSGSGLEYVAGDDYYYFTTPRSLGYLDAKVPGLPLDSQPFRGNNKHTCGEQFETCNAEMTGLAYGTAGLVGFGIAPVEESIYLIQPGTTINGNTVSLVDLAVSSGFTDNAGMAFDPTGIYYTFVAGRGLYETVVNDNSIDGATFSQVFAATNNIQSLAFVGPTTAVPEPGTLSLLLAGLGVLGSRFRSRRE